VNIAQITLAERKLPLRHGLVSLWNCKKPQGTSIFLLILRVQKLNYGSTFVVPRPLAGGKWHLWCLLRTAVGEPNHTKDPVHLPCVWMRAHQHRFCTWCTLKTFIKLFFIQVSEISCVICNLEWRNSNQDFSRGFILLLRSLHYSWNTSFIWHPGEILSA
jgi:hypothetical protein